MTLSPIRPPAPLLPTTGGFLWGASTSAHQTEGNNRNSNWWHLEQSPSSPFSEPSGDAIDSYNRFPTDMRLLAEAGLTAYRFSIEWSRIEPTPGVVDETQLQHYRTMIETARQFGLTPVITLHHFTSPQWFSELGGWRGPDSVEHFRRFVSVAARIVEDAEWICTINEPNMVALAANLFSNQASGTSTGQTASDKGLDNRAVSAFALPVPADDVSAIMTRAHQAAVEELRPRTDAKLGWTVSSQVFESAPEHAAVIDELRWAWEDRFLETSRDDDFVGVQSYTVHQVGATGVLPELPDENNTLTGWANRPDALESAVRHAWEATNGTPIMITENGIATSNDDERIAYTAKALAGLGDAMRDGVDVRGYLHWSALDNYEWGDWAPTFGLIQVDRSTFDRTPRPSLAWLGNLASEDARRHGVTGRGDSHP